MSSIASASERVRVGLALVLAVASGEAKTYAADTIIHVAWDKTPAPLPDVNYIVSTQPGFEDLPDVELRKGSLTWRVWSTDADDPDGLGNIGNLTSPVAENFAVRVETPTGGIGAQNVL